MLELTRCISVLLIATPELTTASSEDSLNVRLPDTLVPDTYWVRLRPDIYDDTAQNFTFQGSMALKFNVSTSTNVITLHYRALDIDQDSISVTALNHPTQTSLQVACY